MVSCLSSAEVDIKVVGGLFVKSKKTCFFFFFFRGLGLGGVSSAGREGSAGEGA